MTSIKDRAQVFEMHENTQASEYRFGYPNWCFHRVTFVRDERTEAMIQYEFVSAGNDTKDQESVVIDTYFVGMNTAIAVLERCVHTSMSDRADNRTLPEDSASYYVDDVDEARQAIGLWVGQQIMRAVDPLKDRHYVVYSKDVGETFIAIDYGVNDVEQVVRICAVVHTPTRVYHLYTKNVYFTHAVEAIGQVKVQTSLWFSQHGHEYNAESYRQAMTRFTQDIIHAIADTKKLNPCRVGYLPVDHDTYQLFLEEGVEGQLIINVEDAMNQFGGELDPDDDDFVKLTFIRRMLKKAHDDNLGDLIVYLA